MTIQYEICGLTRIFLFQKVINRLMDDIIKDPAKAACYYREKFIRSMAAGAKESAVYWKLVADVAKQVVRKSCDNNILPSSGIPFLHQVTALALSTNQAIDSLYRFSEEKNCAWSFEKNIPHEILFHYRYWTLFFIMGCSKNFDREINQLLEGYKKYQLFPQVRYYIEQSLLFFKNAQKFQYQNAENDSLSQVFVVYHWLSAAYEAVYNAHIHVEQTRIDKEKNRKFLKDWESMACYAGEALFFRIKSAESTQQLQDQQAIEYSLAALAMNEALEQKIQMLRLMLSGNEQLSVQFQKSLALLEEIKEKRMALANNQARNSFQENAICWLEMASESDLKKNMALSEQYEKLAAYWESSSLLSRRVALLYTKISLSRKSYSYFNEFWNKVLLSFFEKKAQFSIPLMLIEKIYFSMPEDFFPSRAWRAQWESGEFVEFVEQRNSSLTANTWLYQTGSLLLNAGIHCDFFTKMPYLPQRGIIVTLSGLLYAYPNNLSFCRSLFVVGIAADGGLVHPAAMLHLIPNSSSTKYLPFSEFIPHWSQPFLIPRDLKRGERFETICFMGDSQSIAPELCSQEWHAHLERELGLRFVHRDFKRWHDFSDVDCIVAIRDFSGSSFCYKPANKLYNAWLAGIPFIGGKDSAFSGDGNPGEDYLVANSTQELFMQLKKLKEDPLFRSKLVNNGHLSGALFTREAILQCWKRLVQETIPIRAMKWYQYSDIQRKCLRFLQRVNCKIQYLINKYYKPKNYQFVAGKKTDPFSFTF
ncbi:MAG: hypothetical protein QE493_00165 [Verrucomicrobiae bacterium]|nr:hypothetical protein [Verrucomicrobiae bacterium]